MTPVKEGQLYLSRLILNPRSRQVWSELAQPYEMHKTLMRAFPIVSGDEGIKAREKFGVLFRADEDDRLGRVIVYVQSTVEPDWSFMELLHDYLLDESERPNLASKDVAKTYERLRNGQILSFRLRANPTRKIDTKSGPDGQRRAGKRVELQGEEEQISWLIRKGKEREKKEPGGFEIVMMEVIGRDGKVLRVPSLNVYPEGKLQGRKREEESPHKTTHMAVRFEGLLRITDAGAFRETLARGIGGAKAFGFGLLSVAPIGQANHAD